ncbi:hypothetical protein CN071_30945 [Sinorhizobium meliloti]|nr:hypothetical protein CDO29_35095 [Sinorhizobium meliloti]MDW9476704.1 hypothetical protein [Sinorhizobium meliloti]MQX01078.1 hypothetical protein [Sinorhizobium meliloti]QGJ76753.1 hypothetical protein C3L21_22805 [Sinorhizobium meliloti]RVE81080.1 hypothetical protein CN235_33760 [Sinorhizobium meliloti]
MDQKEGHKSSLEAADLAAATHGGASRARHQCRSAAARKADAVVANTMIAHPRSIFRRRVCLPVQS